VLWQDPSVISAESNKVLTVINLKMRKLSAVESLRHKEKDYVGTAALGCPGAQLRAFDSSAALVAAWHFSDKLERIGKKLSQVGNSIAGHKNQGELRSPGQPRAAVPT
jgi:hypothetical protein